MDWLSFLVGLCTAGLLAQSCGVAYCLWRYCYQPWKVLRRDIAALNTKISEVDSKIADVGAEVGLRKAQVLSDEQILRLERQSRLDALRRAAATEGIFRDA